MNINWKKWLARRGDIPQISRSRAASHPQFSSSIPPSSPLFSLLLGISSLVLCLVQEEEEEKSSLEPLPPFFYSFLILNCVRLYPDKKKQRGERFLRPSSRGCSLFETVDYILLIWNDRTCDCSAKERGNQPRRRVLLSIVARRYILVSFFFFLLVFLLSHKSLAKKKKYVSIFLKPARKKVLNNELNLLVFILQSVKITHFFFFFF